MAKKSGRAKPDGTVVVHRLFGESFSENLHAFMNEQIAEMMKEPKSRRMIEEVQRPHVRGHGRDRS